MDDVRTRLSEARPVIVPDGNGGRALAEEHDFDASIGEGLTLKRATREPKRGELGTQEADR